jgi:hypothetical protein
MPHYLLDTNVLIDFGRDPAARAKLEAAQQAGKVFALGPPALIELVRGLIASGNQHFENDKKVFQWLLGQPCNVLQLPRPFMATILKSASRRRVEVEPEHYLQLMQMLANSPSFEEFVKLSKAPESSWKDIEHADKIHNDVLDREFAGFEKIAKRGRAMDLAKQLARSFGAPGNRPNPVVLHSRFSAALEFLNASLAKVERGAKPRKNDPGLYVDFQLLLYLADPEIVFLTKEDFSNEIKKSKQTNRILSPDSL